MVECKYPPPRPERHQPSDADIASEVRDAITRLNAALMLSRDRSIYVWFRITDGPGGIFGIVDAEIEKREAL